MQNTNKCSTIQPGNIFILIEGSLHKISSFVRIKFTLLSWFKLPLLLGFLMVLLNLTSLKSHAQNIDHVNVGRIAVDNQSLGSQQKAGKQALAQVFIKLSGNQNVLNQPEISKAVDNYEQFLIASSFLQQSPTLVFEATFNQAKVESLLLASGLSVWTSLRPSSVLWLAIDNVDKQKVMLSQFSDLSLYQKINLKSFARGVDIVIPLGDLEESMSLSVYDIWNQHVSKLQQQSSRYATNYLISATVQAYDQEQATLDLTESEVFYNRNNANTNADALDAVVSIDDTSTVIVSAIEDPELGSEDLPRIIQNTAVTNDLLVDTRVPNGTTHKLDYVVTNVEPNTSTKVETGRIFGKSQEAVILKVVDVYANILAKKFALSLPNRQDNETIQVVFQGIDSLQDYVNLMVLIRSIPSVENVRLIRQSSTNALLEIQQNMSTIQLKSILTLDERITAEPITTADAAISFRWLG